ncbi:MAG: hypothetical protein AB7O62_09295 [Pirellulales bacterium]
MARVLTEDSRELVLELFSTQQDDRRIVARAPLEMADLLAVRDETWWTGVRGGMLEPRLENHELRVLPGEEHSGGRLQGYTLEMRDGPRRYRQSFSIHSLYRVAQRKTAELLAQKVPGCEEPLGYHLAAVPAEGEAPPAAASLTKAVQHRRPLVFEVASLADYMRRSEPLRGKSAPPEEIEPRPMQIYIPDDVWEHGTVEAYRGDKNESAAIFTGRLLRDTDSAEVFAVFDACLEAVQAVEQELSVEFTGETWSRIGGMLDLRRRRGHPLEIILGSVHRHPFLPSADAEGRRTCEACSVAKYCSRTTASPSSDDFEWHRCVFAGQPWATLTIHGYTGREEPDFRMYTLADGAFREMTPRRLK